MMQISAANIYRSVKLLIFWNMNPSGKLSYVIGSPADCWVKHYLSVGIAPLERSLGWFLQ